MHHKTYKSEEFFQIQKLPPRPDTPSFANLKITLNKNLNVNLSSHYKELFNPGVYGVFFNKKLIYVGLTRNEKNNNPPSIIYRWKNHLSFFPLRSPEIKFSIRSLHRFLIDGDNPVTNEYNRIFGKKIDSLFELTLMWRTKEFPMLGGNSSSFKKARFAVKNWSTFGERDQFLENFSFTFTQFDREVFFQDGIDSSRYSPRTALELREAKLIDLFQPPLNDETTNERLDVDHNTFLEACEEVMKPIPQWNFPLPAAAAS